MTTPTPELMPFDITPADIGRYVRDKQSGRVGVVKKDAGNGWLYPDIFYEWKYYRDDLEYVEVTATPPAQSDEVAEAMQFLFGNKHKGGFVKDLCYTVWDLCHNPTHEDGNTDWFNDTLPTVEDGKKIIQEKVQALTTPPAQQQEGVVEALEGELRRLAGIILNCETCSNKMLEPIDTAAYRKGEKS